MDSGVPWAATTKVARKAVITTVAIMKPAIIPCLGTNILLSQRSTLQLGSIHDGLRSRGLSLVPQLGLGPLFKIWYLQSQTGVAIKRTCVPFIRLLKFRLEINVSGSKEVRQVGPILEHGPFLRITSRILGGNPITSNTWLPTLIAYWYVPSNSRFMT